MKIHYMSDVHLEFGEHLWTPPDCDVIVIAGDLAPGQMALDYLERVMAPLPIPVIYVPGNHCFWDKNLHYWVQECKRQCDAMGIYFLYNEAVEIKDVVFMGSTLWTDFNLDGDRDYAMTIAPMKMNDYRYIKGTYGEITPLELLGEHLAARKFFDETLASNAGKTCVVVSHHAPSPISLQGHTGPWATFYASQLEDLIMHHAPALWIHGHIHHSNDYLIDGTRVISNPRGYVGHKLNDEFDPTKVVEI